MKTRNFILSFLMMMFCSVTFGQSNGWGDVNPYQYPGSMTVVTYISVDDVIQTGANLELGAFCGDEMRGKASLKKVGQDPNERHLAYITIYGGKVGNDGNDVADDETISFKLYDKTAGKVIFPAAIETIAFANNKVVGTTAEPTTINFKSAAKIEQTGKIYATLADAFAAAQDGETVEMLRNVTEVVNINKTVTFDMAGFTLTGSILAPNANLTVANGTIINNDKNVSAIEIKAGTLTLETTVTVESARHAVRIDGAVVATVNGGKYYSGTTGGTRHALNVSGNATVTILDGEFFGPKGTTADSGAAVNVQSGATVIIIGGEFSGGKRNTLASSGTAALLLKGGKYHQGYPEQGDQFKQYCAEGYMTVKDGDWYEVIEAAAMIVETGVLYATFDEAYSAAKTGETIELFRTAVITNSKPWVNYSTRQITVKAEFGETAFRVQDGAYVWFGGMTIESNDYCIIVGASDGTSGADVEIMGGTYNGVTTAISVTKGELNIQGGTFKVEPYEGSYEYTINCIDANYNNSTAEVSIKGGKFYNFNPQNNAAEGAGTDFLTNKYAAVLDAEGYWNVVEAVAMIEKEGETKCYATLPAAFEAAQAGETIKLLKNAEGAGLSIAKDITIDLGGFKYTINQAVGSQGTESQGFQLLPAAENVTIKNGRIEVAEGTNVVWMFNDYTANLKVENVTIDCANMVWTKSVYLIVANNEHGTNPCPVFSNVNIVNYDVTKRPHALLEYNTEFTAQEGLNVVTDPGYTVKYDGVKYYVAANMVAIGEETYASIADANAAAKAGDVLTFLADITEDATISKAVTIDGAGKTYTGKMTVKADLTIKNVNFDGKGYNGYAVETRGAQYLTIEDCTAKNYGYGFVQLASATALTTVKNVTVSSMNYGVKVDYSGAVVLENVDITAGVAALLNSNYGEKTITIKDSKLNILGTWKRNDTIKTTYVFEGENSVDEFLTEAELDMFKLADVNSTLTAPEGLTVTTDLSGYTVKYAGGKYYVAANMVKVLAGENEVGTYATIAEALVAAQAGNTLVFLADITEEVEVKKAVTIDGAGKTYTGKMTVKADLTIKNVNFDGKGYNGYAVETRGAQYLTIEDCTAKNYGYGFVQLASATVLTTVKNVTVSNMNYGVKVDYSGAVVIENVDITAGVAALLNSNYGEKTITIKDSKLNKLGTWKRNDTTKTTYVFEGENSVDEFLTEAELDMFKLADVNSTLTAPEGLTVTTDLAGYAVKYAGGKYYVAANMVKVLDGANNEVGTYASIAEALAAAQAGNTLVFLADITEDATISKAVTIDGAGKTYTGKMTVKADLTIKNVNFDGKGYNGYAVETRGAQYLTIEDCTAKNYGYGFVQLASATVLTTVKNVTVSNMNYGVKVDYSGAVVIENVDITAGVAALLNSNYGEKTITIKDSKLNKLGTWVRNNTIKTTYVFEGANTVGQWIIDAAIDNFKLATVESTLTAPNEVTVTTDLAGYTVKYADGKYYVAANMVKVLDGANNEVGTYASIAEALAAAQTGNTLVFLADITEDATISKAVTIDGAGKTYTGKMTVKADLAIKNVNFDGKGYNGYAVETRGAQYLTIEDCTAKNYGYGFVQLASATVLTTVKNVTVSSMNYGVKVDYSGAVVLENVDITAGVAALLNSNYGEKTITIKDSKLNILGTWVRNNTIKTTYVFEGANTVGQWIIDAAIDNFKLATVESTLTAPNEVTVTTDLAGYTVKYAEGKYFVAPMMVHTLAKGWNWFSSYIDINGTTGFEKLQTALGTSGLHIKNQHQFVDYNEGWDWNGTLESTSVEEMYMIQTSAEVTLVLEGNIVNPAETEITLQNGWTYIGYPVATAMNIEDALADINPQDGDIIKTHNGVAMYYKDLETESGQLWSGWDGSLQSMTPGMGYMYRNTSGSVKDFTYPTANANTRAEVRANVTSENNRWVPNASAFANNMNIIAVLESNDMMGEFEVAAFVNGEVRGSARPTYVEPIDAYVLFMTIYGEEGEEMTFKYYDIYSDEEHVISNTVAYSDNAVIGSIKEPYMFFANTLGMEENAASALSIYPNPTTTNAAISFDTVYDMVEVFNALGSKVAEYSNVDRIEGMEAAGVYVIRVTNDNAVQNCRLIVK